MLIASLFWLILTIIIVIIIMINTDSTFNSKTPLPYQKNQKIKNQKMS